MDTPVYASLQQQYPDAAPRELAAIAQALGGLALPLELLDDFLTRHRKAAFAEPAALLGELYLAPPYDVFEPPIDKDDIVFRLHNLGRIFQDYARLENARKVFALALAIELERCGENHPKVANALNKLGTVLHDLQQFDAAYEAFAKALAIDEKHYGPQHPNIARDANNLAILLQDSGDMSGAYEYFCRAHGICEDALGAEHPYTLIVQNHLLQLEAVLY